MAVGLDFLLLPLRIGRTASPFRAEVPSPLASVVTFSPLTLALVAAALALTALKGAVLGTMSSRNSRLSLWATVLAFDGPDGPELVSVLGDLVDWN